MKAAIADAVKLEPPFVLKGGFIVKPILKKAHLLCRRLHPLVQRIFQYASLGRLPTTLHLELFEDRLNFELK